MTIITSAHSMDTIFYAMDENGYLYKCWSGEDGAVPESIPESIPLSKNISVGQAEAIDEDISVDSFLKGHIDICGNVYCYKPISPSKVKAPDGIELPLIKDGQLVLSPANTKVFNYGPSDYTIRCLVRELTGNYMEPAISFKKILDSVMEKKGLSLNIKKKYSNSQDEENNIHFLFWGFRFLKDIPDSFEKNNKALFSSDCYCPRFIDRDRESINIEGLKSMDDLKPLITVIDFRRWKEINEAFKEAINIYLKENKNRNAYESFRENNDNKTTMKP